MTRTHTPEYNAVPACLVLDYRRRRPIRLERSGMLTTSVTCELPASSGGRRCQARPADAGRPFPVIAGGQHRRRRGEHAAQPTRLAPHDGCNRLVFCVN